MLLIPIILDSLTIPIPNMPSISTSQYLILPNTSSFYFILFPNQLCLFPITHYLTYTLFPIYPNFLNISYRNPNSLNPFPIVLHYLLQSHIVLSHGFQTPNVRILDSFVYLFLTISLSKSYDHQFVNENLKMKMFKVFYHKYDSSRKWAAYDNLKTRQEERKRQLTFKLEYIRKDDDFKKDKLLNTRCSYLDIEVNMQNETNQANRLR